MGLQFRRRDYRAEEHAHALPRARTDTHPLSASSASHQVKESEGGKDGFFDPLRATDGTAEVSVNAIHLEDISSTATVAGDISSQTRVRKEWIYFKKMLMQRFPVSKTKQISMVSGVVKGVNRAIETSSKDLHSGELDDHKNYEEEDVRVISQQECLKKLQELKDEINRSWCADDRVTSLRLSIKAARLLMDSSVIQFYPTLFVLATDIMDMLGDLVWDRIKQKTEITEGGVVCSLPDDFNAGDISFDAKETCNNWFSKISSVPELLPRIYLELAILPCWRFLHDRSEDILQRLVEMTRGIADPVTSAYCRLYLVQCAQRLPHHDTGYLITCINDLKLLLMRIMPAKEAMDENLSGNSKLLLTLIEPTIEYILKCLFKDLKQMDISNLLVSLGMRSSPTLLFENYSCISIILHYILKELPIGFTCLNAMEFLHLIETTDDGSFDQSFNFKLLGQRLCETVHEVSRVQLVVDKIIQVLSCYDNLDAFLMIADAYLDIILENQLDAFLNVILDGILERMSVGKIDENGLLILQSIFMKTITHFADIEKILAMNHFVDILDLMHGSSRNSINMHILSMATRNGQIQDPTVIEVLLEVAQALYDDLDFSNMRKDDYRHPSRLICRFVYMVDHGTDVESHLRFLAQCRGAFSSISELQEILVHSSNNLAVKAMRDEYSSISFVKSCLAFNEVTVPAIPTSLRQLNLYIETAEVALLGGFISHSDGLINAALNCLSNVDPVNGEQLQPGVYLTAVDEEENHPRRDQIRKYHRRFCPVVDKMLELKKRSSDFIPHCNGHDQFEIEMAYGSSFKVQVTCLTFGRKTPLKQVQVATVLRMAEDGDMIISLICKLCAMLVMVPGSLEQGVASIHRLLLSFLNSQSWIMPGMKAKVLLAIIFLSAAQSQNQLPYGYHPVSREVIGNFHLFYGVQSYHEELLSLSGVVLQDIVNIIMQESSKAVRGKMALEACNCVASSFTMSEETVEVCSKLVEIAQSCLSTGDKFLLSTLKCLDAQQFHV